MRPPVEVADEHALGELRAGDPAREVELGGVLVLAVARVQVEVDAADPLAAGTRRRRSRPPRARCGRPRGHRRPLQAEEAPGDVEKTLAHGLEREVRAHALRVDGQLLLAHELGVVGGVGAVDVGRVGPVLPQPLEQHGLVALGARRPTAR